MFSRFHFAFIRKRVKNLCVSVEFTLFCYSLPHLYYDVCRGRLKSLCESFSFCIFFSKAALGIHDFQALCYHHHHHTIIIIIISTSLSPPPSSSSSSSHHCDDHRFKRRKSTCIQSFHNEDNFFLNYLVSLEFSHEHLQYQQYFN